MVATAAAPTASGLDTGSLRLQSRSWSRLIAVDLVGLGDAMAVIAGGTVPAAIFAIVGDMAVDWPVIIQTSLVAALLLVACLRSWGHYDTARLHDLPIRAPALLLALACGLVGVLGLGIPFRSSQPYLWGWYASWASSSAALLIAHRLAAHLVLARMTRAGAFDLRVAVFGAGGIARRVRDHLANPEIGVRFAGVYDDRMGQERLDTDGVAVAGRLEDLVAMSRAGRIDQIVIALPQVAESRIADVARQLEHLPVSLHVVTHITSDLVDEGTAHRVSNIGPVGLLDVQKKPLSDWAPLVKRLEDVVLAALFLVLTAPLLMLAAIAVKIDSKGPILFRQRRLGLNGQPFDLYKIRTMTVLEDGADVRQAQPGDPRVTRVGRWLRRTSIDELPQLVNVLRGEMSLVGPRPHAVAHDEHYGALVDRYANRARVRPGLTGLAQISGMRGPTETPDKMRQRVELDLEYIRTWSVWLDMKIIALTTFALARGNNAH